MEPVLVRWSAAPRSLRRTLLTDRDGVLATVRLDRPGGPDIVVLDGVVAALERLAAHDVAVVVVTNQGAVGRGEQALERVLAAGELLLNRLDPARVLIDYVAVCPHSDDQDCRCRKPRTGAVTAVERLAGERVRHGWMVGDQVSDMEAARRLRVPGLLVGTGHGRAARHRVEASGAAGHVTFVTDFGAAVTRVVNELCGPCRGAPHSRRRCATA
ncbi:HAD-IIIA family hydrolase [Micromonospora sp. NPDC049645]|uniref:HAD-IIIA family hydrolase n=1 Tax=Micromonospora sp. NPDC049645 TaxID=3155508 RepID=UPI00343A671E